MGTLVLGESDLTIESLMAHLDDPDALVELSPPAWERVMRSSVFFDRIADQDRECYGINTNFGDLASYPIGSVDQVELQKRLVLSHAVGAGSPLPARISRAIFLLRLNSISRGASGILPETLERLLFLYNKKAYPEIFDVGSLGASGDLAPLAHLAAFVMGRGAGFLDGKRMSSERLHEELEVAPVVFARKEGLSLINGTSALTAVGAEALNDIRLYLNAAVLGMALLMDVVRLPLGFLAPEAFTLKPFGGAIRLARHLEHILGHSRPASEDFAVQAQYSFRCVPFILGPLIESLGAASQSVEIEMNAANDNPLFVEGLAIPYHGGHFHGSCVSVALDQLRIAAVHLTGVLDRQLDAVLDGKRAPVLKPYLAVDVARGYCGMEGAQYLLTSLHVSNKALAQPRSIFTIPTNGNNQDYVSLGFHSALATRDMAENIRLSTAVYLVAVHQACALLNHRPTEGVLADTLRHLNAQLGGVYRDDFVLRERIVCAADKSFMSAVGAIKPALERRLA